MITQDGAARGIDRMRNRRCGRAVVNDDFRSNEIKVPGAHLRTFECKRQCLTGAFELSRAIIYLLLERFV